MASKFTFPPDSQGEEHDWKLMSDSTLSSIHDTGHYSATYKPGGQNGSGKTSGKNYCQTENNHKHCCAKKELNGARHSDS